VKKGNPHTIKGKGFDVYPEHIKKGRDKGSKNRATELRKISETTISFENPITKKKEKITVEKAAGLAAYNKALQGDINAYKEIQDTLWGKIKEQLDLSGSITLPITGMKIVKDGTDS